MRLLIRLLVPLVISSSLFGQPAQAAQDKPAIHSWDIFMASPEAVAEAKRLQASGHCDDAQTQDVMNACSKLEFERQDSLLNHAYQKYLAGLDDSGKTKLKGVERAWIQYRDLECRAEGDVEEGGSMRPMVFYGCMAAQTKRRIEDLHNIYD